MTALAALALLTGACATTPIRRPADVLARARSAPSYSARLRVSLKGPEVRARSQALVAFRRPDALRLEIPGPAGARLVAVTRDGALCAVFPGDRAVFRGRAAAPDLEALLGVALSPEEVMDLLVGTPSPRLKSYEARWGASLPREIDARLPDGARLKVRVEEADAPVDLPERAFEEPPHAGYRTIGGEEARRLWAPSPRRRRPLRRAGIHSWRGETRRSRRSEDAR